MDEAQVKAIEKLTESIDKLANMGYAIAELTKEIRSLNETLRAGGVLRSSGPTGSTGARS